MAFALAITFGCASVSQNEIGKDCNSEKVLEDIVGTGESKADATESFRDIARKSCYEICKASTCNVDGNETKCTSTNPQIKSNTAQN